MARTPLKDAAWLTGTAAALRLTSASNPVPTIVNVALPRIATGLSASVAGLQWVVNGYTIALAALMLAGGTVGDLYGHKRVDSPGLAYSRSRRWAAG